MERIILFVLFSGAFMLCDILTGLLYAFKSGTFASSKMREGGFHKACLLLIIVIGAMIDLANIKLEFGLGVEFTIFICTYVIFMEIMSCIENIDKTYPGVLPKKLTDVLKAAASNAGVEQQDDSEH